MNAIDERIIAMSHGYFSNRNVTHKAIREFIELMKKTFDKDDLDEAMLFRRLESIHSVNIGTADTLDDTIDHEEWYNPSTGEGLTRKIDWHFWAHYSDYLTISKGWPRNIVLSLDDLSNQILTRLEDPLRSGPWDRRGMVMGSVQSGKTANYTALISKAADAGYKLFVVLAGVHDSLRSQTQMRLNEEFLGYDLERVQKLTGIEKKIGVRQMFPEHGTVYTLTSSSQKGDFSKPVASQSGIFPSKDSPPIILVIKKNVSILRNLNSWISSIIGQTDQQGHKIIKDIPLLVIDDECDYASVNTKRTPERDENGNIDEDWDPTAINRHIRELLELFDKCSYVGYTATPYANIFINIDSPHPRYGEDLFPRSFIISLPQPSNYLGPERVFGIAGDALHSTTAIEPLPLIRLVNDQTLHLPEGHNKELVIDDLPESLKRSIKFFLLSCAARRLRSNSVPHNSMLIHVTRYTAVQQQIKVLVESELKGCVSRIMSRDSLTDFKEIWEDDFTPTSGKMVDLGFKDAECHKWEDIEASLGIIARTVQVRMINGTVRDILEYKEAEIAANNRKQAGENVPWEDRGLSVIAIGGDKLSRGLTLEGLTISYYLRASTLYDTLMQMGRWFGYKDGYTDLCRIFTTEELVSWYQHIAVATKELREDILYMSALKLTPKEFGLRIRGHPGRLLVTSLGKSRNKEMILLSYSGRIPETVVFDPKHLRNNMRALEGMLKEIGRKPDTTDKERFRWIGVPSGTILNFLSRYKTHDIAKTVDPIVIAKYIETQNARNELIDWNVIIVSNPKSQGTSTIAIGECEIQCVLRTPLTISNDKISIRRLVSPSDEILDLSEDERRIAREYDRNVLRKTTSDNDLPSGTAIRIVRPKERGLLLIYFPEGKDPETEQSYGGKDQEVVGFAISFPRSDTAVPIEYWANSVYQKEEDHYI